MNLNNVLYALFLLSLLLAIFLNPWFLIGAFALAYFTWAPLLSKIRRARRDRLDEAATQRRATFDSVFALLAILAKVDGRVSEEEVEVVEKFMRRELQLSRSERRRGIRIFRDAKERRGEFETLLNNFSASVEESRLVHLATMDLFCRLAAADGAVSEAEETLLRTAAERFGLDSNVYRHFMYGARQQQSGYEQQRERNDTSQGAENGNGYNGAREGAADSPHSTASLQTDYSLLNCSADATDEELKKQHRKMAKALHPDSAKARGLPKAMVRVAEEKFKSVQAAYDRVLEHRAQSSLGESQAS